MTAFILPAQLQRACVHSVSGALIRGHRYRPGCEPHLALGLVTADPHDAVAAHDRVHRIRLPPERLGVRAGDLGAGEVVETALASRVAVDDTYRPLPPRLLTRLARQDVRLG